MSARSRQLAGGAGGGAVALGASFGGDSQRRVIQSANTIDKILSNMRLNVEREGGEMGLWSTTLRDQRMVDIPLLFCQVCRKRFVDILKSGDDLLRLEKNDMKYIETESSESCKSTSFRVNYNKVVRSIPASLMSDAISNKQKLRDIFQRADRDDDEKEDVKLVTAEMFIAPDDFRPIPARREGAAWWEREDGRTNDEPFVCTGCYMSPHLFYANPRDPKGYENVEDFVRLSESEDAFEGAYRDYVGALETTAMRRLWSRRSPFAVDDESKMFLNFGHVDPAVYYNPDLLPRATLDSDGMSAPLPLDRHRYVTAAIIKPAFVRFGNDGDGDEDEAEAEAEDEDESDDSNPQKITYEEFKTRISDISLEEASGYVMADVCVVKASARLVDQIPGRAFTPTSFVSGPFCGMGSWRYLPGSACLVQIAPSVRGDPYVLPAFFKETEGDGLTARIEFMLPGARETRVDVQSLTTSGVGFAPNRVFINETIAGLVKNYETIIRDDKRAMILDNRSHVDTNLLIDYQMCYTQLELPSPESVDIFVQTLQNMNCRRVPVLVFQTPPGPAGKVVSISKIEVERTKPVMVARSRLPEFLEFEKAIKLEANREYVLFLGREFTSELLNRSMSDDSDHAKKIPEAFCLYYTRWANNMDEAVTNFDRIKTKIDSALKRARAKLSVLAEEKSRQPQQLQIVASCISNIERIVEEIRDARFGEYKRRHGDLYQKRDVDELLSMYDLGEIAHLRGLRTEIHRLVCNLVQPRQKGERARISRKTYESRFSNDGASRIADRALPEFESDRQAAGYLAWSAICILTQKEFMKTASLTINGLCEVVGDLPVHGRSVLAGLARTWTAALAFGARPIVPVLTFKVAKLLEGSPSVEDLYESLPTELKDPDTFLERRTALHALSVQFHKVLKSGTHPKRTFESFMEQEKKRICGFETEVLSPFCKDRLYAFSKLTDRDRLLELLRRKNGLNAAGLIGLLLKEQLIRNTEGLIQFGLLCAGAIQDGVERPKITVGIMEAEDPKSAGFEVFDLAFLEKARLAIGVKASDHQVFKAFLGDKPLRVSPDVISEIPILKRFVEACGIDRSNVGTPFEIGGDIAVVAAGAAFFQTFRAHLGQLKVGSFMEAWIAASHAGAVGDAKDVSDNVLIAIGSNLRVKAGARAALALASILHKGETACVRRDVRSSLVSHGEEIVLAPNPTQRHRPMTVSKYPLALSLSPRYSDWIPFLCDPLVSREYYNLLAVLRSSLVGFTPEEFSYLTEFHPMEWFFYSGPSRVLEKISSRSLQDGRRRIVSIKSVPTLNRDQLAANLLELLLDTPRPTTKP